MLQDYLVFGFDFGLRLQILRFFSQYREHAEIRRNTQANTPSKNTRSYREKIYT